MTASWSTMTADEKRAYVAERVRAERAAQGLPPTIEDPDVLDRAAVIARPLSSSRRAA